jgi:hypothetical protein
MAEAENDRLAVGFVQALDAATLTKVFAGAHLVKAMHGVTYR